jgi:selenocysteine-specific elongation factor
MIAGVGSVDLALFIVATDDGWMPQSEEHLQILNYLGVTRAVIVLSKSDLGRIDFVTDQIRRQLHDTSFADAPIVPTSVRTGDGIEKLTNMLATELARTEPHRDIGKPRLFVDRVFTLRGIGTIVTGTLTGGPLRRGQQIVVYPANLETRIRSIQSHGQELQVAQPGMRTAVNLPDVPLDQIKRGDVVTIRDLGPAGSTLVVILERSARLHREDRAARPLKNGSSIFLHHGTSRVAARITGLETDRLEPGEKTIARIKLVAPILAFAGDRFVVRNPSERHTLAGGMVLDPNNQDTKVDDKHKRSLLMARATAPDQIEFWVRSEVALHRFVSVKMLLNQSNFSAEAIADAVMRLDREKKIVVRGEITADAHFWRNLRVQAVALIDQAHKQNPERAGVDLNALRSALRIQQPAIFEALLADLCDGDFIRKGSAVARISHRPTLPVGVQPIEKRIREALTEKPFDPPSRKTIESDPQAQQVVRFLIENGNMTELAPDVVLLRESFERMKSQVADFISKNGPATVSELRQSLGSSRRVMVPLLERLDRDGVTRRVADKRTLCKIPNL